MGRIRVGTLHDFRRSEHKEGLADSQEGKKAVAHHIEDLRIPYANAPKIGETRDSRALKQFGSLQIENMDVALSNVTFSQTFDQPDCFVLCSSENCSRETMEEFEGADSCVEIVDVAEFYNLLTAALNDFISVIFRGVHKVIYQDRQETWNGRDWGHNPALKKDPKYKRQQELRAIWQPGTNQPIKPVILTSNRIGKLCRSIRI